MRDGSRVMVQVVAPECRTTLVTASRTTNPKTSRPAGVTSSTAWGSTGRMPAARRTDAAAASSTASDVPRMPAAVARTSVSDSRASRSTSTISRVAAAGSRSMSRRARPAFTAIAVSEWPRMSCRSRAIRARSAVTAALASSSRVCRSSLVSLMLPANPPIHSVRATTVTASSHWGPSGACQVNATMAAPSVSPTTSACRHGSIRPAATPR